MNLLVLDAGPDHASGTVLSIAASRPALLREECHPGSPGVVRAAKWHQRHHAACDLSPEQRP